MDRDKVNKASRDLKQINEYIELYNNDDTDVDLEYEKYLDCRQAELLEILREFLDIHDSKVPKSPFR